MAEAIEMPRLSDTMTEGVIAAWHKNVGDTVKKGDLLAEIETDKATMDLESYNNGVLLHRGAENGQKLQVNDLLAVIGKEGEDVKDIVSKYGGAEKQETPAQKNEAPDTQHVAVVQPPQKGASAQSNQELPAENKEMPPAGSEQKPAPQNEAKPSLENTAAPDLSKMEQVVLMPRLSDTMTEGVIASWQKNVGDDVKKGDVLAEIETDKATMELESYKNGVLLYQGAKAGEKIAVNDLLCIIGEKGMDITSILASAKGANAEASPVPPPARENEPEEIAPQPAAETQQPSALQPGNEAQQEPLVNEGRIIASPLAKKMAEAKGIDLKTVKGSGDNGRIVKQDVDSFQPSQPVQAQAQPAIQQPAQQPVQQTATPETTAKPQPAPAAGQESFEEVPVSQMRKVIAKRLAESKFSAPHFYLTMSIDMDKAVESRTKLNELSPVKISFNDMVLKAVALALKQHPKVNSSWLGDKIRINHHVHIGVAVAVDEGLLVPVVRFADAKSLSQIATEVKQFAQKAKDKKLQPADWEGSTFTISNLGMFGVEAFTAIINPPASCILAIGGISQVPVVKNNQVVPGNVMKITLSCDHRAVDGATGAAFLQTLESLLEEPLMMLV